MLLIQTCSDDLSTDKVMDWIFYLSPDTGVTRLNDTSEIEGLRIALSDTDDQIQISLRSETIDSRGLKGYWYRRGEFSFSSLVRGSVYEQLGSKAKAFIERELSYVMACIDYTLHESARGLNKPLDNYASKLQNLRLAKQAGLAIPDTLVTNNVNDLADFIKSKGQVMSKPILFASFVAAVDDGAPLGISGCNTLLTEADLPELLAANSSSGFLPSLFQAYVDKMIEIRSFFINGTCYSMAIFSQSNEKTKTDFRNYDYNRPNRCVAYQLPDAIENKLGAFMQSAHLDCGSIDIILSKEKQYVFLEVNPIGQYDWLSYHCNYFLDKLIAQTLLTT